MAVALEIVSPEKLLLSRSVDMVVIPAAEGDMGVLEGHSPMIVTLRGGTIALYEGDRVSEQMFVSGGFAEVTTERCTVLATEVLAMADLSRAEGEKRLSAAEAGYDAAAKEGVEAEDVALDAIQTARAMIEAAG